MPVCVDLGIEWEFSWRKKFDLKKDKCSAERKDVWGIYQNLF
jgi:hypothetical protein